MCDNLGKDLGKHPTWVLLVQSKAKQPPLAKEPDGGKSLAKFLLRDGASSLTLSNRDFNIIPEPTLG